MQLDDLHTGVNGDDQGSTFGNEVVPPITTEAIQEQKRMIAEMLPGVDYLIDKVDEAIDGVSDMHGYMAELGPNAKASDIQDEYRARTRFILLCERLKDDLNTKTAGAKEIASRGE